MADTHISKKVRVIIKGEHKADIVIEDSLKDPRSLINKCPATIFAVSRTDSVIGRIICLISSIITIIGINITGVPVGRR
jgi:hypothetical protein